MNILQKIFTDHYEELLYLLYPRQVVIENVDRMIHCGAPPSTVKSFQTALLNQLEHRIGPSFRKTKAFIYRKDKNGFYVYARPNLCDTNTMINK